MRTAVPDAGVFVDDLPPLPKEAKRPPLKRAPGLPSGVGADSLPREEIIIFQPAPGATVESPLSVTGVTGLTRGTLHVAVLDIGGAAIGSGVASMTMTTGRLAHFAARVPFEPPANTQQGRLQVWLESHYDGAVEHLSSLTVKIQGLDLDPLLEHIENALLAKDYCDLQDVAVTPFLVIRQRAERQDQEFISADALEGFLRLRMEEGSPVMDFSISPRQFLAMSAASGLELVHAVYSTGWGASREERAWMLIDSFEGRARWTGIWFLAG